LAKTSPAVAAGFASPRKKSPSGLACTGPRSATWSVVGALPRIDTAMKLAAAIEAQIGELVEGISWASGDYRAGAFVLDSKRQPSIRRQLSQ
jgi:hypothetical protein